MSRAQLICVAMMLATLSLMVVGCRLVPGAQPAPTPQPPATPLPPVPPSANTPTPFEMKLQTTPRKTELTKVIDGYLHTRYLPPCEIVPSPAEWVASIVLTDMRSGSIAYLNRDGTVKFTDYRTDEGQATLEAALKDSALVKQIVARPACPSAVYNPSMQQLDGWPDAYAEGIGDPPMPKVAMGTWPKFAESPPPYGYPGWRGTYCWPIGGNARECEDNADWKGFGSAEALEPGRFYITVLGDDANPGRISRVRVFPAEERRANRGRSRELQLGAEVHRVVATREESLEKFILPSLPNGDYMLIATYESPLGEIECGFKFSFGK